MRSAILLCFLVPLILLTACASTNKQQAEQAAVNYMKSQGRFYTAGNTSQTMSDVALSNITSYKDNGMWNVAIHVSAMKDGKPVQNEVILVVDNSGKVVGGRAGKI